jgi:tRNA modification GTPase
MFFSRDEESIVAQCTPRGSGALALLRISGSNALIVADAMSRLPDDKHLDQVPTHTIHYGWVVDEYRNPIDQVLFLVMKAPKTFTGQDTVEITCHNNPFLIESILQRAVTCGARLAGNGEFTRRSFLQGKIDLLQAEAVNDLIHASNQMTLKQSMAQIQGSFSQWIEHIEKNLITCLALSEASFEFIDEEMEFGVQIGERLTTLLNEIVRIKEMFDQQKHIRQGVRIALIGSVNAGKSSLFNALLGQSRAIVSDVAGTTRDVIEAGLYKESGYWTLIDTAGLRQTHDVIEQEGIKRSFLEAQKSDIILLVVDSSRDMTEQEETIYKQIYTDFFSKIIIIRTKTDMPQSVLPEFCNSGIEISVHDAQSSHNLERELVKKIKALFYSAESPFLLNQRHYTVLLKLEQKLRDIKEMIEPPVQYELVSYHLKDSLENLTELSGKTISEQGMDAVFREFCVGK